MAAIHAFLSIINHFLKNDNNDDDDDDGNNDSDDDRLDWLKNYPLIVFLNSN